MVYPCVKYKSTKIINLYFKQKWEWAWRQNKTSSKRTIKKTHKNDWQSSARQIQSHRVQRCKTMCKTNKMFSFRWRSVVSGMLRIDEEELATPGESLSVAGGRNERFDLQGSERRPAGRWEMWFNGRQAERRRDGERENKRLLEKSEGKRVSWLSWKLLSATTPPRQAHEGGSPALATREGGGWRRRGGG